MADGQDQRGAPEKRHGGTGHVISSRDVLQCISGGYGGQQGGFDQSNYGQSQGGGGGTGPAAAVGVQVWRWGVRVQGEYGSSGGMGPAGGGTGPAAAVTAREVEEAAAQAGAAAAEGADNEALTIRISQLSHR